jgi:hypothetical protein
MINTTRRKFLRDASMTATGLVVTSQLGAKKQDVRAKTIQCAPRQSFALTGTISTIQSGNWSNPATWGGKLPTPSDIPLISSGHIVTYDMASAGYGGLSISSGATLEFDSGRSATYQSSGNVVVEGKLAMRPSNASITHFLQFINIDESKFVGGGMDPIATDVGLWVMGSGLLDLVGASKTSFVRAAGNIAAGATSIPLGTTPAGWQANDNITIAPTQSPTVGNAYLTGFEDRSITSISGSTIGLNAATIRVHPQINNQWAAEVINLSRNVRIEGTPGGRTHVFIRSSVPQNIQYVQLRYLGPRKPTIRASEFVLGRYGMHFHHCMDGSVGTMVQGCVIRDCDSHAYVPHVSHGITMKGNVAYNVTEVVFWWDELDLTHGVLWDSNIVALAKFIPGSSNSLTVSSFLLGIGDDNVCTNNVVVGNPGDFRIGGAYMWMEGLIESPWTFNGNMAHNCSGGLVSWQNNEQHHIIEDFVLYNCVTGIYGGAYVNSYVYRNGQLYNSPIMVKAASLSSNRAKYENLVIDAAGLEYAVILDEGPLDGPYPVFIRNCTITGHTKAGIINQSPVGAKRLDVIQCNIAGTAGGTLSKPTAQVDLYLSSAAGVKENFRVQPVNGQPYLLTHSGKTDIAPFAPTVWGNGSGLKGEYYKDASFSNLVFTRIDPNIVFQEWMRLGVHHKIPGKVYSMRWTGQVMAQFSEAYTFQLNAGGGHRLWVDGKLILDRFQEQYPNSFKSSPINLAAGQKYDIKLEYFNSDDRSVLELLWSSPSTALEFIPMSQLFASTIGQPPGNQTPIASAGSDITITLPTNSITLDGTSSRDSDGKIVTYAWTKIAGPGQGNITSQGNASTAVTGLGAGVYVFRLTVTDDKGATAYDDVTVTVKAANQGPVANAGADINITLPTNTTTLNGGASKDPDGTIVKSVWTKINGPASYGIGDPNSLATALGSLVAGTYVFRLTVTDDKGATATDDVNVIVNNANVPSNQPPTASAGTDVSIVLPTNSVTLNGSGSKDTNGYIAKYAWSKVSGPSQFMISSPGSAITIINNLIAGTYVFRLTVTDNSGATANDDITIVVNNTASPGNQSPVSDPGSNITVQLPKASVPLDGSRSYDPDGSIISYKWTKVSGPTTFTLVTPNAATTELRNMVPGTYVFRLAVTDDKGAVDTHTMTVTVLAEKTGSGSNSGSGSGLGVLTVVPDNNPSTGAFWLTISSANTDSIFMHVYDASGGRVTSIYNISNNKARVTVGAHWKAGIYTAVVWQGNKTAVVKLIKA